jgi:hypothetical protein
VSQSRVALWMADQMDNAIKTMTMQMENEDSSNMPTPQQNQNPTCGSSR